jgi:hypothetical protein
MLLLGQRNRYLLELEKALKAEYPSGPESLFTWEESFAHRLGIRDRWWKPDLRWHINAAMPVFGFIASGSLVLGAYKGFEAAPVIVVAVGSVEFLVLAGVGLGLAWELGTFAHRGPEGIPAKNRPSP